MIQLFSGSEQNTVKLLLVILSSTVGKKTARRTQTCSSCDYWLKQVTDVADELIIDFSKKQNGHSAPFHQWGMCGEGKAVRHHRREDHRLPSPLPRTPLHFPLPQKSPVHFNRHLPPRTPPARMAGFLVTKNKDKQTFEKVFIQKPSPH